MILFPAIDLKDGECVRLVHGDMDKVTVFNRDPADQAAKFERQGFTWLHIVDLNGAFAGRPVNADAVSAVLSRVRLKVQLGGGIRDLATIEAWLSKGVERVILGTVAVKNPDLVREACRKWPGRVAIGVDARDGFVAVEGWAETSSLSALALAQRLEDAGAAALIYTDISRDGGLTGVNVEATADLASRIKTPVIASGGVSSIQDLARLKAVAKSGIAGVISGRALYDGRIDPEAALKLLAA